MFWIPSQTESFLDVGCNVGELLQHVRHRLPSARLTGVDINPQAVAAARDRGLDANVQLISSSALPFPDSSFDCVTCIEVLEHVASPDRASLLKEVCRVLTPGGRFVIRCPHKGWFDWLDPANFRHLFPALYRRFVGSGLRDGFYPGGSEAIVWHHHFTETELRLLLPEQLQIDSVRRGGLLLFPLAAALSYPFYRMGRHDHPVARALARLSTWEYGLDHGNASCGILMLAKKLR